jgi:hypothetical protein
VPFGAWSLGAAIPVVARQDGRDVSRALAAEDDAFAGWTHRTPWVGIAEPHALELDVPAGARVLVLTGSLNFPNSSSLFAASQSSTSLEPPKLEVRDGSRWKQLAADCGAPAGFHKDVVIDLASLHGKPATLRITTNLEVTWDRAAAYADARAVDAAAFRELPLVRAEKQRCGIPSEVQGPENRWREFPHDILDARPSWLPQAGSVTGQGDVRDLVAEQDGALAVVRSGEEVLLGFDESSLGEVASGKTRTLVLRTFGWVKDRDPHTALSESVDPAPRVGSETYP